MTNLVNFNANKAHDTSNNLLSGATADFFDTGTTDAQTVYTNKDLSTGPVTQITADSAGLFAPIFSKDVTDLKVVVKTSSGSTLYTIDPALVQTTGGGASTVSFTPTSRISDSDVQNAIVKVDTLLADLEEEVKDITASTGSSSAFLLAHTGYTAYTTDDTFNFRANHASTGATTLNVESVGSKSIKKYDNANAKVALIARDIMIGQIHIVTYDGTDFVLRTKALATATESGNVELGTLAEGTTGTDTLRVATIDVADAMIVERNKVVAWVNFNGTGTIAIRDSGNAQFNVSSVTDNSTGDYTINFNSALANAHYCPVFGTTGRGGDAICVQGGANFGTAVTKTTSALRIEATTGGATLTDAEEIYAAMLR